MDKLKSFIRKHKEEPGVEIVGEDNETKVDIDGSLEEPQQGGENEMILKVTSKMLQDLKDKIHHKTGGRKKKSKKKRYKKKKSTKKNKKRKRQRKSRRKSRRKKRY